MVGNDMVPDDMVPDDMVPKETRSEDVAFGVHSAPLWPQYIGELSCRSLTFRCEIVFARTRFLVQARHFFAPRRHAKARHRQQALGGICAQVRDVARTAPGSVGCDQRTRGSALRGPPYGSLCSSDALP